MRVGWNEQKNGPNFIPQGISVKEESYSNDNGDFTCRFTLDKIMKFAKPSKIIIKSFQATAIHISLITNSLCPSVLFLVIVH